MIKLPFPSSLRRCTLLVAMLMLAVMAWAVPAKPKLTRNIALSNGSVIAATLVGDEHGHYWLGADGQAYQAVADGDVFRPIEAQTISAKAKVRRSRANERRTRRLAPRRADEKGGITGQKKGLIILVNFSQQSFKEADNNALYKRIANEPNFSYGNFKGSMYDYFYAQSEGQFELTFDVVGPVPVSKNYSYYGKNDSEGNDLYPATMVIEALRLADDDVNYADYDWDGDGEVDQVYVVYAGKGEADGGASNTIWPHEWLLSEATLFGDGEGAITLDGVTIDTYACGPELDGLTGTIAGIGTMCHEFSHCLGYPDFYDIDYSGGQGMFEWDLMDTGSYNGNGFLPAGYTSYERWMAGWKTPIELNSTQSVTGMKALADGGETYVIYNNGNRDEYFMLENRQQIGWDTDIPGEGLLILHVDYSEMAWADNSPNDDPKHQRMTWIAADNNYQYIMSQGTKYFTEDGAANDPFPYGSVNAFSKSTTPAAKFFNKNADGTYYLDSSIEQITQNADGTISFRFKGVSNIATPQFSPKAGRYAEAQTVSITCATEGAVIYYTIDGTTPTPESTVYTEPFTISETTTIQAIAVKDGEESALGTALFTIGASASDPNTTTFKWVSSTDELESGMRYIIACGSKEMAAGPLTSGYLNSRGVRIDDDVVTIADGVCVFVLEGNQADGWTLFNETDETYLYATEAKKLAEDTNPHVWTLADGANGGVIMSYANCGTMLYNANNPRFNVYTSKPNTSMIQAHLFMEYPDGVAPEPIDTTAVDTTATDTTTIVPVPTNGRYQLVTSAASLAAGQQMLIAYVSGDGVWVLGTNQRNNNREATTDVTLNDDATLTPGAEAQVITLEEDGGDFLFNVGAGYLYAAGGGNYLRTSPTSCDEAVATISIAANGDATIEFSATTTNNNLRFNPNSGAPIFSCYGLSSSVKALPRIYRALPQDDTPTGIGKMGEGRWKKQGTVIYSLSGQRLTAPHKGVNIINGKKVVVK